jgi:hypothetical protein
MRAGCPCSVQQDLIRDDRAFEFSSNGEFADKILFVRRQTMQPSELLSTLVEFSVAVAGFAGVVAAMSPQRLSEWTELQRVFFSALLGSTAISAGVSILAMVMLSAPVSASAAWSATSSVHLVLLLAVLVIRSLEARADDSAVSPTSILIFVAVCGLVLLQGINAVLVHAGWLCVAGLSAYAFLSLLYFVVLVRQLWSNS